MSRRVRYLPPFARARGLKRPARPVAAAPVVEAPKVQAPKPVKAAAPKPAPPAPDPEPVRARDDDGHFVADDPTTPDVNESFVGGTPLKPEWDAKMNKTDLLKVAATMGLDLSMDNTKKEILAALEGTKG